MIRMHRWSSSGISCFKALQCLLLKRSNTSDVLSCRTVEEDDDPFYTDIPRPPKGKTERKPYLTPMKVLIRRARKERRDRKENPCRMLESAPDNGLLVPELIPVARKVYLARESLRLGLSKLSESIHVHRCRHCREVHVGDAGHELHTCTGPNCSFRHGKHEWMKGGKEDVVHFPNCYHLHDPVGRPRVVHKEKSTVPRVPAVVELCLQAGLDLRDFPVRRRSKPVYSIEGRIVDFEGEDTRGEDESSPEDLRCEEPGDGMSLREVGVWTMDKWSAMVSGTEELMEVYRVNTCGYCPEVQVGPKGHKVRVCGASKHQSRDGMHAWQEARIDDLIGPNYVWHARDPHGPPLANDLKRYYGKAPAVIEMCSQAGSPVPNLYRSMMRLEVVIPDRDEVDLVA